MSGLATRLSGGLVAGVGCVLVAFFLVDAVTSTTPSYWIVQSYPIALSVALAVVGGLLARGRLVADRFLRRLLAWMVVGIVVFSLFLVWFYSLAVLLRGRVLLETPVGIVTLPSLGALAGLLIGTYDARAIEGRQAVQRSNRTTETLRVATGELVEQTDRDALERAVCRRLVESDSFDAAWIGRYDAEDGRVRPSAWAGVGDDGIAGSFVVPDGGRSAESVLRRAVETADVQLVQDALSDERTGQWRTPLDRHGVGSVAVVPIADSDRVYGLVGICTDRPNAFDEHQRDVFAELGETVGHAIISIRAHDELAVRERELLEQNERLDEFVGVVSHDLRNPLNVLLAQVAAMEATDGGDDLDVLERAGHRMEEIIADLLELSRSSRPAVDLEPVRLATVAEKSWRNVETDGIELDPRLPETLVVRAVPSRLQTVFENLFRNASEHNDAPLTVRVGAIGTPTAAADGESFGGFFVEDDGDGIPADERGDVFDHGYTTNTDGTGLGLSIVRGIVDAHDWEISVRGGREGGTRFEVTGVELETRPTDVGTRLPVGRDGRSWEEYRSGMAER